MNQILNAPTHWAGETTTQTHKSTRKQWLAFADTQTKNQTLWFVFSLMVQGIFFLPIPAVLIFYYQAPLIVIVITMALFFANVIAGMCSAGIRGLLSLFALSVIVNLLMLAVFIL